MIAERWAAVKRYLSDADKRNNPAYLPSRTVGGKGYDGFVVALVAS